VSVHPVNLLGAAFVALFWLVSLRRTPYAFAWLCAGVVMAVGAFVAGQAMSASANNSVWGVAGAQMAFAAAAGLVAMITEFLAHDTICSNAVRMWRREHPKSSVPTIPQPRFLRSEESRKWKVRTGLPAQDGRVPVFVRMGDAEREIGRADPIADMEGFMNLKTRASEAASQFNALKIGWEPKGRK